MRALVILLLLLAFAPVSCRESADVGDRPETPAIVWRNAMTGYDGTSSTRHGRVSYQFSLPDQNIRVLMVEFREALDGAKVDVTAYGHGGTFPLLSEKRIAGQEVLVSWEHRDVETVVVNVHRHVRNVPVVKRWRMGELAP